MSIFAKSEEGNGNSSEHFRKDVSPGRIRSGSDPSGEVSIVGRGVRIEGDIHVTGDVRVGGRINGAVYVQGRIVVACEGVILGAIQAGEGDIAGKVEGDIVAKGRLVIRKTASMLGSLSAEQLMVEEGAVIDGTCKIGKPNRTPTERGELGDGAAEGIPTLLPFEDEESISNG